ncbi:MAG: hypothetical protein QOD96_7544 [Pseudonocardiales bacterium]|jgi:hypothetical protein|nr:hypothetical protein [Pseudonocardiales bacterium]
MHALGKTLDIRHLVVAMLAAAAIFAAIAAVPSHSSGDGLLASVGPQSAEAFEGGFDGDHAWVKISAGDVAGGAAEAICRRYAGPFGATCPSFAARASELVGGGASGVWAEVYINHVNVGTW